MTNDPYTTKRLAHAHGLINGPDHIPVPLEPWYAHNVSLFQREDRDAVLLRDMDNPAGCVESSVWCDLDG